MGIETQERSHEQVMLVLVPLMMVLFMATLDQTIVATVLPTIGQQFGEVANTPWVATSFLLTSAVTTLLFGKLGDMYGRKPIFLVSIVVFLAGSVLCGFAPGLWWLVAFRAFQGIGGGGLASLAMAVIGDILPARTRSKYMAYTGIVSTLALIGGPFLGGLFADTIGWQWIFFINVPIGIVALIVIGARVTLPKPPPPSGRIDVAGGITVTIFTTTLLLATSLGGQDLSWNSPSIIALLATAAVSLVAYLLIEQRSQHPITPLRLFRSGVFTISVVQFFLANLVLFVAMVFVPLFLQTVRDYSAFIAGLALIPMFIGLIIATSIAGPLITKTGKYKIYPILAAVMTGVSMWALGYVDPTTSVWIVTTPLVFVGAGAGLFVQVALLGGQNAAPYSDLGVATGALNFFKTLGGAFGTAIFSAIFAASTTAATNNTAMAAGFRTTFRWTVPLMALSLILGVIMPEKPLSEEMMEVAEGKVEAPEY
ncbi:MAG: MFS transporter [Microthrixaceae bacterium]|nr:MFS transporter [Microthrixaceae bacterium]